MDDLIERLRAYIAQREKIRDGGITITECNGVPLTVTDLREAAAALEAAREDAERLALLATDGCVEGFIGVEKDIYEYASDVAEESGREEPNESDMLNGLRRLVDAAIDAAREARNG